MTTPRPVRAAEPHPWLATWALGGGVLSAVQGGLGLLLFRRMLDPKNAAEHRLLGVLISRVDSYLLVQVGKAALVLLLGVALVTAVGGLFTGAAWARRVAVGYGLVAIPTHLAYVAFELGLVLPAMRAARAIDPAAAADTATGVAMFAGGFAAHAAVLMMAVLIPAVCRARHPTGRPSDGEGRHTPELRPSGSAAGSRTNAT